MKKKLIQKKWFSRKNITEKVIEYVRRFFDFNTIAGYVAVNLVAGFICWIYFKIIHRKDITIIGKRNLPKQGKIIFYSNHLSMIDPLLLQFSLSWPRCIPKPWFLSYIPAAKENFFPADSRNIPWLRKIPFIRDTKLFAWLMHHGHAIPVAKDRKGKRKDSKVLRKLVKNIKNGKNVIIFPEGTRTRDGSLGKFRQGITTLIGGGKPDYIIPVWIDGMARVLPIGQEKPDWKRGKVTVIIGQSIKYKVDAMQDIGYKEKRSWLRKKFGLLKFRNKKEKRTNMTELLREELLKLKP